VTMDEAVRFAQADIGRGVPFVCVSSSAVRAGGWGEGDNGRGSGLTDVGRACFSSVCPLVVRCRRVRRRGGDNGRSNGQTDSSMDGKRMATDEGVARLSSVWPLASGTRGVGARVTMDGATDKRTLGGRAARPFVRW
jgi:hypothetical protein